MSKRCSSCSAVIESGMRVCPNCGRLLASIGDRHEYQPDNSRKAVPASAPKPAPENSRRRVRPQSGQQGTPKRPARDAAKKIRKKSPAPAAKAVRAPERAVPPREEDAERLPGWRRAVKITAVTAVILAAVYFALFGLQVLRIRHSTYKFDTSMTLSASDYGEAFDKSVTGGSWSYNPFTFTMTYKGEHDGKDIAVKFSAGLELDVKSVTVGEEEKTEKEQINIYLMGLFI